MIVLSFMKQISNSKLSSNFDIACICLGCSVKLDVDMQYCCSTWTRGSRDAVLLLSNRFIRFQLRNLFLVWSLSMLTADLI